MDNYSYYYLEGVRNESMNDLSKCDRMMNYLGKRSLDIGEKCNQQRCINQQVGDNVSNGY